MRKDGFTVCANNYINCLRQEGRYATAHVYENALRSFTIFCGTECVSFSLITRENLKRYSSYLMSCRLKLNTISTYMRMLRCIYNKGVDTHQAPYIHRLFRDVFTGVDTRQKKAIPIDELHTLLYKDPQSENAFRRSCSSGKVEFGGEYIEVQPYQDGNSNEYRNLRIGFMYCFPTS